MPSSVPVARAKQATTARGGIVQALLAQRQDKGRRDESEAETGRRSDVENFIRCCVFNVCRATWRTYFGRGAVMQWARV